MLKIVEDLFEKFHRENILYCHWKSNEHLKEGLNGETDLDILVERDQFEQVNVILNSLGYKRCESISYLNYNSIEDFIGYDYIAGKIVHIHLHYNLVIGKKFIKGYHLPLEKDIFETRIINEEHNVYTISPEYEIIFLVIRRALKYTFKDKIKFWSNIFPPGEEREFLWLKDRIDITKIAQIAEELINERYKNLLIEFINDKDRFKFNQLTKLTKNHLNKYSLYSKITRTLLYYKNKFKLVLNYVCFKFLNHPIPYRRSLKTNGTIVAIMGVDGSGKSTMIKEINDAFSWKFDVQNIYFGSGDGRSSLLRWPLRLLVKVRSIFKKKNTSNDNLKNKRNPKKNKNKSFIYRFTKAIWAITLAIEKKKKFKKMWKAKSKGMLVLCDRYPQIQFFGFNDGPLLRDWANSRLAIKRKISDWEYEIYKLSKTYEPDVVIKLKIPEKVAAQRKNTPLYRIKNKIDVIENVEFGENTEVYEINTEKNSIEETSLKIKNIIWSK